MTGQFISKPGFCVGQTPRAEKCKSVGDLYNNSVLHFILYIIIINRHQFPDPENALFYIHI